MPDDDLYGDSEDMAAEPTKNDAESSGSADSTALLPTDFFQGKELKPGNRCEVQIERVHDDQVEVSYVPHSDQEESSEKASAPAPEEETADSMY